MTAGLPSSAPHQRLLLMPGMDGTRLLFPPLLSALQRTLPPGLEAQVLEYPPIPKANYDSLLPLVLQAIDDGPPCHLLGWSFSGPLAIHAAAARPQQVLRVMLAASFVQAPWRTLPALRPLIRTPVFASVRFLRRLPLWLSRPPDDPLRQAKARLWREVPARTLAARARAIASVDARSALACLTQPVLYLAAANDRIVPPHNLQQVLSLRPATQVAELPGGHFMLYTHAAESAAAIVDFVSASLADGRSPASGQ
jgi:pimeloyl-ACP methyl ester carboxylesterase